jgi:hypothetical protein
VSAKRKRGKGGKEKRGRRETGAGDVETRRWGEEPSDITERLRDTEDYGPLIVIY